MYILKIRKLSKISVLTQNSLFLLTNDVYPHIEDKISNNLILYSLCIVCYVKWNKIVFSHYSKIRNEYLEK